MIKYLGSKRTLIPTLTTLAAASGATSALDLFSEEMILETLHSLREKITVIIIAHSDKPLDFADKIFEME